MFRIFYLLLFSILFSCTNSKQEDVSTTGEIKTNNLPSKKDLPTLLKRVKELEDSIMQEVNKNPSKPISSFVFLDLINRLKDVTNNFPKEVETASCLFKLHMKYGEMKGFKESIAYGDTLLKRFPEFKDRDLILQSIATTYDISIKPRNPEKVSEYLKLLLSSETLPENEKTEIKTRLKFIHLDVITYSTKVNQRPAIKK